MSYDEHDSAIRTSLRRVSVVSVDDKGSDKSKQQRIKLSGLKGEELDKVVHAQSYGMSSVPPKGSEGVLLTQGGRADRSQVLALEHPDSRPRNRKVGEVTIYDDQAQEIHISRDGIRIKGGKNDLPMQIDIGSARVTITKDQITLKCAKIVLDGDVYLGGADADKPAAMQGSVDSGGDVETSNLSTKVFVK
jgi:phage baseplate assembly protein V